MNNENAQISSVSTSANSLNVREGGEDETKALKKIDRWLLGIGGGLLLVPLVTSIALYYSWFGMTMKSAVFLTGVLSYLSFWFAGMGGLIAGSAALVEGLPQCLVQKRYYEGALLVFLGACCAVSGMIPGEQSLPFIGVLAAICFVALIYVGYRNIPEKGDHALIRVVIWSAVLGGFYAVYRFLVAHST